MVQHYQIVVEENLEDINAKLQKYFYEVENTYGLKIEVISEDLSYFEAAQDKVVYKFDSQGGSYVAPIKNIEKGDTVTVPRAPKKEGKIFGGWFSERKGMGQQLTHTTKAKKNMTWYAFWTDEEGGSATLLSKLNKNEYGFHVIDSEGRPVKGAEVIRKDSRGEVKMITDADGDVKFKKFTVGQISLTVKKKGYQKYTDKEYEVSKAGYDIITIYKEGQETYKLTKAEYFSSVSLLRETEEDKPKKGLDLLKKAKRVADNSPVIMKIKCETASGDTAGERMELWQDSKKIADANSEGVFDDLTPKDFSSGKGIHVRVYYDPLNSEKFSRTSLNLEIVSTPTVKNSLALGDGAEFSVSDDVPFLGGCTLSLGLPTVPVEFYASEDTIHLGVNLKKGILDKEQQREELKEWASSMQQAYACGSLSPSKMNAKIKEYCSRNNYVAMSGWSIKPPELSVVGYFEGELAEGIQAATLKGYICVSIAGSAKYGWTVPTVFSIPVMAEVEAGFEGKLSATGSYKIEESNLSGTIALNLGGSLEAMGGVGVSGVTAAGVTGRAALDIEFYLASTNGAPGLNAVTLSGGLGIKAYMGSAEVKKDFPDGIWHIYTRNNEKSFALYQSDRVLELYDADNYSAVDRTYLEKQSTWLGEETSGDGLQNLITNTYGGSDPQIVTANGKTVMVFRYDDSSRDTPNMGQLMYSVQKDGVWQKPRPVDNNELADIRFQLYSDGNNIYLTYQEAVEKLTEKTSALNELLKHTQLRVAEFDMEAESFRESTALTEAESVVYASNAKYVTVDGKNIAVWIGNTNSDIFNLNNTNQILVRAFENGQWGATKTLLKNSNHILSMDIGKLGDQIMIIYSVDQDNDLNTSEDQELYCMDMEGNSRLLGKGGFSGIQFVKDSGTDISGVIWNQNGQICYLENPDKESVALTKTEISSDYVVCGRRIYYLASDANGNQNVFAVQRMADGAWSSALQITNQSQQIISMDAAQVNGEDWLVLTQSNMDFENEVNNLCWLKVGESHELVLTETSFEMDQAVPGTKLPVTLTVNNSGSCNVSSIGYRAETEEGEILTEGSVEVSIPAGKTQTVDIGVDIPDSGTEKAIIIQIWMLQDGKKAAEISENNNSARIITSLTDISTSMELYTTAGKNIALINVTNESQVPSGGRLNLYVSGDPKGMIKTEELPELQPGESESFKLELENDVFENVVNAAELVADAETNVSDYDPDNNISSAVIEQELSITYYVDGSLYKTDFYSANEEIILPDAPVGEGTFAGWYSEDERLEEGTRASESKEYYAVFRDETIAVLDTEGKFHWFETWEEYLSSEITEKSVEITILGKVILEEDFTVGEKTKLLIETNGNLRVAEGCTLSNGGALINYGIFRIDGKLENTGSIYNENSMLINTNGQLLNRGLLSNSQDLENKGIIIGEKGSRLFNSGVLTTENGTISGGLDNTGTILGQDKIEGEVTSHEHVYSEEFTVDIESTCTKFGIQSRHCTSEGCGAKTDVTEISMQAHEFGEWEILKEPTETSTGLRQHTCVRCGTVESERTEFSEEELWKDIQAHDGTGVYNGEKYSISITGLKDTDTVFYSTAGQESYSEEQPWFVNAGTYTVYYKIVKESGRNKEGSAEVRITPADLSRTTIEAIGLQYYTGKAVTPSVKVKYGSAILKAEQDYTLSYANNVKPGTAQITVTGRKNFTGRKTALFTIAEKYHAYGSWRTTRAATVFSAGERQRVCSVCGKAEKQSVAKLNPTIKLNTKSIVLKYGMSTTKVKASGFAAGDAIASWKSSNSKIVTVNSRGKITAKRRTGKAVITITLKSGKKATISVRVQKTTVKTSKISGISKKLTLQKGKKYRLVPVLTPITSQEKIRYSTSNKKVALVSSKGVITAKGAGKAVITVTSGKKRAKITVTVPKVKTTKISGVKTVITLRRGKSYKLRAGVYPRNSDERITYSSSNTKVVSVDQAGRIKAKKKGTATVYVKSGKIRVRCRVTVK